MSEKVNELPDETEGLVELQTYLTEVGTLWSLHNGYIMITPWSILGIITAIIHVVEFYFI